MVVIANAQVRHVNHVGGHITSIAPQNIPLFRKGALEYTRNSSKTASFGKEEVLERWLLNVRIAGTPYGPLARSTLENRFEGW